MRSIVTRKSKKNCAGCQSWLRAFILIAAGTVLISGQSIDALPLGFGVHQDELEYSQIVDNDFAVYHGKVVPNEGKMIFESLRAAKPVLENWFGVERHRRLNVVMSHVTDGASFANFITDSIELQTLGLGGRDLAWHEFVHATMYRYFDNFLGPPGAILHLPWLPAWFIEGLAESVSMSIGSYAQSGIERYHVLTGAWPDYARLHSLYGKGGFFLEGYGTAGAFVGYIFRRGPNQLLKPLMTEFYDLSKPWWWPWTLVPFNGFLPLDAALEKYHGKNAEALFVDYKAAATKYWLSRKDLVTLGNYSVPRWQGSTRGLIVDGSEVGLTEATRGVINYRLVQFDQYGWGVKSLGKQLSRFAQKERDEGTLPFTYGPDWARVREVENYKGKLSYRIEIDGKVIRENIQDVWQFVANGDRLAWMQHDGEATSFCWVLRTSKASLEKPDCFYASMPKSLDWLGIYAQSKSVQEVYLAQREQGLTGDRSRIIVWNGSTGKFRELGDLAGVNSYPQSLTRAGKKVWLLAAHSHSQVIRQIDSETGVCLGEFSPMEYLVGLHGLQNGELVGVIFDGSSQNLLKISDPAKFLHPCKKDAPPTSPLLVAMAKPGINFDEALLAAAAWSPVENTEKELEKGIEPNLSAIKAGPADGNWKPFSLAEGQQSSDRKWNARPVLLFPWVGGEDALGAQYGMVSIPLMDDLQNETVRLTVLYGAESKFPSSSLNLVTTRYWPTISLDIFRMQTFNGALVQNQRTYPVYYDDVGIKLGSEWQAVLGGESYGLELGTKVSRLQPMWVRDDGLADLQGVRVRNVIEPYINLSSQHRFQIGDLGWNVQGRAAPAGINPYHDYNSLGSDISLGLRTGSKVKASVGIEGSRTRGKRPHLLREYYTPLKTFVPGSGGGYNQNSFAVAGTGGLFGAQYGDSKGRAKLNLSYPIVEDLNKLLWILYLERIDMSAFYNYGGAWSRASLPKKGQLTPAHGYNVDLQMENKGVRANVGIGVGQVFGDQFQIYMKTGFDALF